MENREKGLLERFRHCKRSELIYEELIALGKSLPQAPINEMDKENLVEGCQSVMYLKTSYKEGKLFFKVFSEALISRGLAALLVYFYDGLTPEEILKTPPDFIKKLGITASITPGRSNGLASLYKKIRQIALSHVLMEQNLNQAGSGDNT